MKIDILCSDPAHPVVPWLERWIAEHHQGHNLALLHDRADLRGGDILFLVSCAQRIPHEERARFGHVMVLHASDLPQGRGWSPHVWAILEGARQITVSLLVADDPVDSGAIWAKRRFDVPLGALHDEIHAALFEAELALMSDALQLVADGAEPVPQPATGATYYERRRPADSELDPARPLADLFDQIRVADPTRYPAFFHLRGETYTVELTKVTRDEDPDHRRA